MNRSFPPLNWLRAFEAAARHKNLTRAAAELLVTQGAISQQVKNLEEHLGTKLFRRVARGLELTDVGRAYLPTVSDVFDRLNDGTKDLFSPRTATPLTGRVSVSFAHFWLLPRLHRFQQRFNGTPIRLYGAISPYAQTLDVVDFEILYGHGLWPNCRSEKLTKDEWIVVCSPELLARKGHAPSPDELVEWPLIQPVGNEDGWRHWFRAAGLPDIEVQPILGFDTSVLAITAAIEGGGVLLINSFSAEPALKAGKLVKAHELALESSEAYYFTTPTDAMALPRVEAFRQWLYEELVTDRIDVL